MQLYVAHVSIAHNNNLAVVCDNVQCSMFYTSSSGS